LNVSGDTIQNWAFVRALRGIKPGQPDSSV
jgi:hypothetical protein